MNNSRRKFIKTGALAIAGTAMFSSEIFAAKKRKEILGIQLYSVRDDMMKDPSGTLKQLADMGYKYVEHANYINRKFYGYSASEFKKVLDDLGLKMPSGHTVMGKQHWDADKKDFTDAWKYTVEDAAICGQRYVISPWLDVSMRKTIDDFKAYMDVFNKSGELCNKSGMKFGYHNHDFELKPNKDGVVILDYLLEHLDPKYVNFGMDLYWVIKAGADPVAYFQKYPGRFKIWHVKDMDSEGRFAPVGKGTIDFKRILANKKRSGMKYFIVEQDQTYDGLQPMEAIKISKEGLKKFGFN